MVKKFKISALFMSVALIAAIGTGCSTSQSQPANAGSGAASESSASSAASTISSAAEASAASGKQLRVGFSQCQSSDPWRVAEIKSIKDAAASHNVDLIYTDAGGNQAKQVSDIEDLIAQKPNYLVIDPLTEDGVVTALADAKQANVKVIVIDRHAKGTAGEDFITYLGNDSVWEGKAAAEWLVKLKNGKSNIVEITGTPGSSTEIDKAKGFRDGLQGNPDMKIIASQTGNYARADAQKVMMNIIQSKGKTFDTVFTHNDEEALGVIQALKSAGIKPTKDVTVIGGDGEKEAVQSIINGEMTMTVTNRNDFGPLAFDTIDKLVKGATVPTSIMQDNYVIDSKNAKEKVSTAF